MEIKLLLREKDRQVIAKNFRTGTLLAQGGAPRGQSAYEQAVEGGYEGTKAEFEEALATGITTISENITDVNTVADNIADISTVADNIADIHTVAENIADVNTVADNVTDVNTVAGISSDVTQVSSISNAVQTVSSHDSEVTLVADNMASVMTTASNIGDVSTVAGISADVSTVADNNSNVTAVAGNSANINAVAGNEANINAVNANKTNIDTVAGNNTNITTVATNISNVNTAVTNMAAIIAAPTAAQNAATSATNSQKWAEGTDSDVTPLGGTHSSKGWADVAKQYAESIGAALKYKGSVASYSALPSTGQEIGDMWNVLDTGKNYAWTGTEWDDLAGVVDLSAYRTAANQDIIDGNLSTAITNHTGNTGNPHSVTASQVGLGNVDNTSDLNKPISTATQTALNAKQDTLTAGNNITISSNVISANVPANVYTADNLLAGENITFVQQNAQKLVTYTSYSTYIYKSNVSWSSSSTFEYQIKFRYAYSSPYQCLGVAGYSNASHNIGIYVDDQGSGIVSVEHINRNITPIVMRKTSSIALTEGVDYWLKVTSDSSENYTVKYSTNGTDWNVLIPTYSAAGKMDYIAQNFYIGTSPAAVSATSPYSYLHNTFDLNQTYLKINGNYIINGQDASTYTIVGSPTIVNYTSGTTVNADLSGKQDTLVSGTNIKTVNGNSLLGSGNVDALPSQTGNNGKFLTTDGTDASWATVDALPAQSGQSGKFLTTNGSAASWANVDALPSQTGNQGKYLTTNGTTASWDIPMAGLPMFYATYQPRKLNNASWLRADPYSWHSADVYVSAYAHLADNISGVTAQTETIAGTTITFYPLSDEIKVVLPDQETNLDTIYNATGIGYYFVLDTTNRQFKLPRNIYGFTGYRGDVGGYVAPGLPNITGTFDGNNYSSYKTGAFYQTGVGLTDGDGNNNGVQIGFDASRSSSIYGNSTTVQPPATQAYLYFYVGNTVQNETSVDVAEMTESLNDKVDLTSSWGTPSSNYDDLVLGATDISYTAPADGWFILIKMATGGNQLCAMFNDTSKMKASQTSTVNGQEMCISVYANKGEKVFVYYNVAGTLNAFRFIYAQKTN